MQDLTNVIMDFLKKFSPFIIGGAIGAVVDRMRKEMTWFAFFKSIVISMFISICVGIVCRDYFEIKSENLIFVFCGISGSFSKIILDEVETILKLAPDVVRSKLGITKKVETDEPSI